MSERIVRRQAGGHSLRVEQRADGRTVLSGYAAVFWREGAPETEYEMWRDCWEHVLPGCFDRALREDDVRACFNHDPSQLLGRLQAGTLQLSVDAVGLRYEVEPPDTELGRQVVASVRRGDVTGSSFSFNHRITRWVETERDGRRVTVCELLDVTLFDVGPVTFPAYPATTAGARAEDAGLAGPLADYRAWQRSQADRRARERFRRLRLHELVD